MDIGRINSFNDRITEIRLEMKNGVTDVRLVYLTRELKQIGKRLLKESR